MSFSLRKSLALMASAVVVPFFVAVPSADADVAKRKTAAPTWAPAATATIHPGTQMFTDGAQCTANFVFSDGVSVYVGYAAHCAGTGAATDTDGCSTQSLPWELMWRVSSSATWTHQVFVSTRGEPNPSVATKASATGRRVTSRTAVRTELSASG